VHQPHHPPPGRNGGHGLRPRPRRRCNGIGQGRQRTAAAELDAQARAVPGGCDHACRTDPRRCGRPGQI
ncbi:MAG: hypothetical protein AVDCRST_MAG44-1481, partial [uncultured Sphingomonas sp.]